MRFIVRSILYKILLHVALAFFFVFFCVYTMSDECVYMEQCSVIKFLVRKNKTTAEIINECVWHTYIEEYSSEEVGGLFPKWKRIRGR